jgi:hypothetical protein
MCSFLPLRINDLCPKFRLLHYSTALCFVFWVFEIFHFRRARRKRGEQGFEKESSGESTHTQCEMSDRCACFSLSDTSIAQYTKHASTRVGQRTARSLRKKLKQWGARFLSHIRRRCGCLQKLFTTQNQDRRSSFRATPSTRRLSSPSCLLIIASSCR